MKTATKNSGIGRRRGAKNKKSIQTSLLVALVAFCVTFFVIIGIYLSNYSSPQEIHATTEVLKDIPLVDATRKYLKKKHTKRDVDVLREAAINRLGKAKKMGNNGAAEVDRENNETIATKHDKYYPILRSEVHLIDLDLSRLTAGKSGKYAGAKGKFCKLDWNLHKYNPPKYPMFRFLVDESGCNDRENIVTVEISTLMDKVKEYDERIQQQADEGNDISDIDGYVHVMPPAGFVFHESRVGSTLVANSLAAMDPEAHRVFSESNPINQALQAPEGEAAANLFRDVVYLMGRTNSPKEKHMFFKVSSAGTKRMKLMREAFPSTPWIFVYRNPVQTMMSHLDPSKIGKKTTGIQAVCTKSKRHPPPDTIKLVEESGRQIEEISDIEFCAAHLASLCESALKELRKSSTGRAVEYDGLVDKLIADVIPNHFGVEMTEEAKQNILEVSKTYSKNKGSKKSEWSEDSEKKEERASKEIVDASETFMTKTYDELKTFTTK
eukprot:scaffold10954_cov74-Cyclotella_meneghiniana.AAC.2